MERIKLTKEKLTEILRESDNPDKMEFYYNTALNDGFEADQHMALVGLLLILVRHYHTKLFAHQQVNPLDFFGLKTFNEDSEYWEFYELLKRTNFQIALCLIKDENIPEKPLIEFSEIQAYSLFCYGNYLASLKYCQNAIARDENNSICNFLKACVLDLCYINKSSNLYKIALLNYQKQLIDKCDVSNIGLDKAICLKVVEEIEEKVKLLGIHESQVNFTPVFEKIEKTKEIIPEWTEEHDFYLKNNFFLNPLSNFGKFAECTLEELEELPIKQEFKNLFDEVVNDYKLCRGIAFSYYKGINNVGKREMSMTYSYAYSIFDKIAFLLKKVYDLDINEDNVFFTKNGLFDAKIKGTEIKFGNIKNINIASLYLLMKDVRSKQKITNALQVGTMEHNELRNAIDHKSIFLVEEGKLKRNTSFLLENVRNAILYTFMLLYGYSENKDYETPSTISTTFFRAIINSIKNTKNDESKI